MVCSKMGKDEVIDVKIIAATANKGKAAEIEKIFSALGFEVVTMREAGIDSDPEENGKTFLENALIKARAAHELAENAYIIADDSGLCVDALGGAPGIYSARYAGDGATDAEKIEKLLRELDGVETRAAHFETAVALITPDGEEITAHGKVHGHILTEPEGDNGFGYDPVFYCDEIGKTFAIASNDEKNAVSHRGRALHALYEKMKNKVGEDE